MNMQNEQIFDSVVDKIIEQSANAGAADRIRIYAESSRFSLITPDQMEDALKSLAYEGSLQILSRDDHDQQYTSFELLLKKPLLDRVKKVQVAVPLTEPEKLSDMNLTALLGLINQMEAKLEMTQESEISCSIQPEVQTAFDYLMQSGCVHLLEGNRVSVYRHVFNDLYERVRDAKESRKQVHSSEISKSRDLGDFYFDQGVLFRHGNSGVEKFRESSIEHLILVVAFKEPFGERIDSATHPIECSWESLYQAARRINEKVQERFGVPDFFAVDFGGKHIRRNVR